MLMVVYRCFHCDDLHFASEQARRCAEIGDGWVDAAYTEWLRTIDRGEVPWPKKMEYRKQPSTLSEQKMWEALREVFALEDLLRQWWVPATDYRVDFLIGKDLILEVDGNSHTGCEGRDRLRSIVLRALGYSVARARADEVVDDAARIAAMVAFRAGSDRVSEFAEAASA